MSPRKTLTNCGSSSSLWSRSQRPIGGDAVVVGGRDRRPVPVGVDIHRAEFADLEQPPVAPDALLPEDRRAGRRADDHQAQTGRRAGKESSSEPGDDEDIQQAPQRRAVAGLGNRGSVCGWHHDSVDSSHLFIINSCLLVVATRPDGGRSKIAWKKPTSRKDLHSCWGQRGSPWSDSF